MRGLTLCICGLVALLVSGCVNISNRITPENLSVKPMVEGSDCSYFFFGFGYGANTVEQAIGNSVPTISKIRSVSLDSFGLLFFGQTCLTVVGEPAPGVTKPASYDPTAHQ